MHAGRSQHRAVILRFSLGEKHRLLHPPLLDPPSDLTYHGVNYAATHKSIIYATIH